MSDQTFQCPECDRQPFPTIKGWKSHMTRTHSGFTSEQLNEAMGGNNEGVALSGANSLEDEIANLPLTEEDAAAQSILSEQERRVATEQQREVSKEARAAAKRIRLKFDNLKKKVSTDVPEQIFKYGGIEMDAEQKQWLGESIETSFDVFGINFEVEPLNFTVRNPLWVLLYPVLVIAFIVASKIMDSKKQQDGDNPELPPPA